jgi:hypothetical protein
MEGEVITLQDLFVAKAPGEETAAATGGSRLLLPLACSGLKPHFLEKLAANGVVVTPSFFAQDEEAQRQSFAVPRYGGLQ